MRASDVGALAFVVACVAVACSGAKETELFGPAPSGTPGPSGAPTEPSGPAQGGTSSGAASSSGTSGAGTSSGSAADAGPTTCQPGDAEACEPDEYCRVEGCAPAGGACTKKATFEAGAYEPVCGCDGVTYWNKELASARGVNVAASGACPVAGARRCDQQSKCPDGAWCSMELGSRAGCLADVASGGRCWVLPASCPPVAAQRARFCNAPRCMSLCDAIKGERRFFTVASCAEGG